MSISRMAVTSSSNPDPYAADTNKLLLEMAKVNLEVLCSRDVVVLEKNQHLSSAFRTLVDNDINSCPVVDNDGKYVGLLTIKDCLEVALEIFGNQTYRPVKGSPAYKRQKDQWRETRVSSKVKFEPTLSPSQSVLTALEGLGRGNRHSMAVVSHTNRVLGIVSQMSILSWLDEIIDGYPMIARAPLNSIRPFNFVQTFPSTSKTIDAMKTLISQNYSAVGVVNELNQLEDVLSVKDLKGVDPETLTFRWLFNSITYFKDQCREEDEDTPLDPVVISSMEHSTFQDCLSRMASNYVHRVFIVKERKNMQVQDIISTTDMINYLLSLRNRTAAIEDVE